MSNSYGGKSILEDFCSSKTVAAFNLLLLEIESQAHASQKLPLEIHAAGVPRLLAFDLILGGVVERPARNKITPMDGHFDKFFRKGKGTKGQIVLGITGVTEYHHVLVRPPEKLELITFLIVG